MFDRVLLVPFLHKGFKRHFLKKIWIYEKYKFNLIELNDNDIQNLDDVLPKKLLKFGIQAF